MPARVPRGAGSGYSFTLGFAVALVVAVVLWLVWLVGWSLRSGVPPEPVTPTATIAAAPVIVATTQAVATPTPPPPPTPIVAPPPPPPTPVVVVVVVPPTPTPRVVVVVPPTPVVVVVPPPVLPPPATPTPPTARIGQPVESAGLVLTVNAAAKQLALEPGTPAGAGKVFLVVDVTLANERRDMPVPYAPTDFVIRDGSGAEHDALVPFGEAALLAGQLAPGGRVTGRLAFEVPTTARGFVLRYQPSVALPGFQPIRVVLGD